MVSSKNIAIDVNYRIDYGGAFMVIQRVDPLRRQVYDHLHEQMNSGQLRPGDFINQAELMEALGVSRTPLRDSLMQLEAEGFVSIIPCKGVQISELTLEGIRHIYEIAGALEAAAFEQVFSLVDIPRLKKLTLVIEETDAAMNTGNFDCCNENNLLFHETLLELCDNAPLLKTLRCSRERLFDFPHLGVNEGARRCEKAYWQEHREIVRLFKAGTAHEVGDYMRYVHWGFDRVEEHIKIFYHL